jgi:MFS family permease
MAVSAFFVGIAVQGTVQHTVPLLTDRGLPVALATSVLSMAGIAMVIGRTGQGYLLDRYFAPYVGACFFLLPVVGILLLSSGWAGVVPFAAIFCVGMATGAEVGLLAYLVGRYFGLRFYAQMYGFMMMCFLGGSGLGPLVMGVCFDRTGSYNGALAFFAAILLVSGFLISRLGAYVYTRAGAAEQPQAMVTRGAAS